MSFYDTIEKRFHDWNYKTRNIIFALIVVICYFYGMKHGPNFKDLSGKVFGRLTVVELSGKGKNSASIWMCNCSCGNKKLVSTASLMSGKVRSCGCLWDDIASSIRLTHGHTVNKSPTPEYIAWSGMIRRCSCGPDDKDYQRYAGRGISVHPKWRKSFECFLKDVASIPS